MVQTSKTPPAKADPREPDTVADKTPGSTAVPVTDASNTVPLDQHDEGQSDLYGFRSIDASTAKETLEAGEGAIEPERHVAVNTEGSSTFASRRAAREKRGDTKVDPSKITSK